MLTDSSRVTRSAGSVGGAARLAAVSAPGSGSGIHAPM